MPEIRVSAWVRAGSDSDMSAIADLVLDGAGRLYSTTRFDGTLTSWSLGGGGLGRGPVLSWGRADEAGAVPALALLPLESGPALLSGGGHSGALALVPLVAGRPAPAQSLGLSRLPADLGDPEVRVAADGSLQVYGAVGTGIGRLALTAEGRLAGSWHIADTAGLALAGTAALASAQIGGQGWLFAAAGGEVALTAFRIGATGGLTAAGSLTPEDGLWIAAPTALEAVMLGGRCYLVLAAAGSGSLSVIAVGPDGTLGPADQVLDDLGSRFGGVQALAVAQAGDAAYVVAGGADDGISLFRLLPGGRLVALAHLADSAAAGLANVSALAAEIRDGGLDIYAASSSEPGLTRLRVELGSGRLVAGGAGDDRLAGTAGADILCDGAGSDVLTGAAGADVFVLAADGRPDTIADFTLGQDRLDLSLWPMLRGPGQLDFAPLAGGLKLRFGGEELLLRSADGRAIDPDALTLADLLGCTRLTGSGAGGGDGPLVLRGGGGGDRLVGGLAGEILAGLGGDDLLLGRGGRDRLYGGFDDDRLVGSRRNDRLDGGTGDDRLRGGAGADRFVYGDGADRVLDFDPAQDRLLLRAAWLWDGGMDAIRLLSSYAEVRGGDTLLDFGDGDVLRLQGLADPELLLGRIDLI